MQYATMVARVSMVLIAIRVIAYGLTRVDIARHVLSNVIRVFARIIRHVMQMVTLSNVYVNPVIQVRTVQLEWTRAEMSLINRHVYTVANAAVVAILILHVNVQKVDWENSVSLWICVFWIIHARIMPRAYS